MKVKSSRQRFNTPINIGGAPMDNPDESESVDKRTERYLADRRGRILQQAQMAELEHATEEEKTEAARQRKERELLEAGKVSPIRPEEVNMEDIEHKVEAAAEVAAEAAGAGVDPEQATNLGAGKTRVVVVKPQPREEDKKDAGGWSVFEGRPIRDPEGDYTFAQALKIAQLEHPPAPTGDNKKSLGEELADAKQKLEAIGVKVGSPAAAPPRSLKEEVTEAMGLLESLGLSVGTNAQAPLKEQVAEAKSLLEGLGLSIGMPGESLESVKEKHRHEESMEAVKADREYKQKITSIAGDIPERVGRGLAGQVGEEKGGSSRKHSSGGDELDSITCEECGQKIYLTPETQNEVTCPKCGAIFTKTSTAESKTE